MTFSNEYHGNMHVLTQTMRGVPLEVIPDFGPQIIRLSLFMDNDYVKSSVKIQKSSNHCLTLGRLSSI